MDMNKENIRHDWTPLRSKGFPRTVHSSPSKNPRSSPAPAEVPTARTRREPFASVTTRYYGSESLYIGSNSTPVEENHFPSMANVPTSRTNFDEPTGPPTVVEVPTATPETSVESDGTRVIASDVSSVTTEHGEESDGSSVTLEQPPVVGSGVLHESKKETDCASSCTESPSLFSVGGIETAVPVTDAAQSNPYHDEPEGTTIQQGCESLPLLGVLVSRICKLFRRRGLFHTASPNPNSVVGFETAAPASTEAEENDPYGDEQETTTDQQCCAPLPVLGISGVTIAQACAFVGGACGHVATAASIGLTGLTFAVTRQETNRKLSKIEAVQKRQGQQLESHGKQLDEILNLLKKRHHS